MNKEILQIFNQPNYAFLPRIGGQFCVLFLACFMVANDLSAQITITLESEPPSCGDFTDGKINASISGGQQPYTIEWNDGHDGLSLIGIGYGDYSITVTDANGEMATASETLTGPAIIEPVFTFTDDVCAGPSTSVRVEGSGGVPPYTYEWDNGSTDVDRENLDFGNYCVTITDAVGCRGAGCVTVPMAFDINVRVFPPLCPAGCDAAAVVDVFGGQQPYNILWNNGVTTSLNPMLLPGTYSVTVTDANGCEISSVAKVPDGTGTLEITSMEVVNPTCGEGGSITVTAEGTNPPLNYLWNNGETTPNLTDLVAGTYRLTVTDVNNCKTTDEVTLVDNTDLTAEITTDYICGEEFGSATAMATGGQPPYTFAWNHGQQGPEATGLTPAETYKVSVTDATGCTVTQTTVIADFDELIVNIASKNPSCYGVPDAEVTAVVGGGNGEFQYFWNGGQQRETLTFLSGGTYSVTVYDENGCGGTASVTINEPDPLEIDIETTDATCGDLNSGSAIATVIGGTPPYSYNWTNDSKFPEAEGLDPGVHSIMVRDANGCEVFQVIEIGETADLLVSITTEDADCGEASGAAEVAIEGGTEPYTIEWSTGATEAGIEDLGAGTYTVTITDANNCEVVNEVEITETSGLEASITKTDLVCSGDADGTIELVVTGGTMPYTYDWSNGATTAALDALEEGAYTVTVVDANGCQLIEQIEITAPPAVIVDVEKKNIICGEDTGNAIATAFGGTGAFTYEWSNGVNNREIANLTPGTYTVTVTDGSGCTAEASIEITEVGEEVTAEIEVNAYPMGDAANGSLTAVGIGGVEPYSYEWSTRAFTQTINELPAGSYSVTVIDASGCFGVAEIDLEALADLTCTVEVMAEISANGAADGTVEVVTEGGLPPYTYEWEDGTTTASIENLSPGTYSVTVTDANGNTTACSIELAEAPEICINLDDPGRIGYDQALCGPGNDPAPLVNLEWPSGGEGEVEYLWMKTTKPGPFNPTTWDMIPNSNSPTYDPGPIYETTYIARCARIVGCPFYLETDIITLEVLDVAVAEFVSAHVPVCLNEPVNFEALDNGPGATYLWNFGTNASPSTSTDIAVDVTWASKGIKRVSLTVEKDGCISSNYLWVTVTDSPIYCGDGLQIDADPEEEEEEVVITWDKDKDTDGPNPDEITDEEEKTVFEVERASADGIFIPIDKVYEPFDSTETTYKYRYVDRNPLEGISYYKINYIDRWRTQIESNTADVQMFDEELGDIFAYPNPFFQIFTIERVDFHTEDPITLDIRSASGQHVIMTGLSKEELRKKIDMDLFPSGVYFVRVYKEDEELTTFSLVKANH